jgi:Bacterial archaeo-eukaryotic release factor family 2
MNTVRSAVDLATARELVHPPTPVASVYVGLAAADKVADAEEDLLLRWRAIESRLAGQGADRATIDAVGSVVARALPDQGELAVFAADGRVLLAQPIPGGSPFDRTRFGAPADVVPLLAWLQRRPPYVLVVTDRTGADVTAAPGGGTPATTWTVVGPDDEIERNAPGGWSQPRYQRRAEDSWQHNAAAVAESVTRALRDVRAGLLMVAGDVRAVQLLRDHLPPAVRRQLVLRHLPGGRGNDGAHAARQAAIDTAVREYVANRSWIALERFGERGPRATTHGAAATLAALATGRVDTLFVSTLVDDARTAWFGPDLLCAASPDEVPADGAGSVLEGRLVDVAVRAALLTDAEVCIVDQPFPEGIGASCRFDLARLTGWAKR